MWVRTTWASSYLACLRSPARLDRSRAAPPTRNRQLGMSMDRSLPKYQFWVMFSVDTISTRKLGYVCSSSRARATEMTPAEQPMPPRL